MNDNFYKQLIEKLPIGYAYHKIICDKQGNPCDYEFLEINDSFAKITRLKASEIVGKKISEILPEIKKDEFDWIKLYGEIAIHGGEKEFEQYSQILKRWYRVKVYSPQEYCLITIFIDITTEMRGLEEKTTILTTLNDIVFELDKDYRLNNIIASNDNYLFIPREKIIGRTIKELFSEELTKIFISSFEKALVSGKKESIIYKSTLQNNEQWLKAEIKHTEFGGNKKYIVSISNITEQKKLEDNLLKKTQDLLRIERERLENILKGTNVGTWEWDIETGKIVFNERLAEILGYKVNELSPSKVETLQSLIHHEDLKKSEIQLKKIFSKEIDYYDIELRMKHKNGSWVWIQDRGKVTSWNSEGKPLLMRGTHNDITNHKQVENKLRKSEEKYRLIFEHSPLGVYHFNNRGIITDCNENLVKIIGSSREALIGLNTLKLEDKRLVEAISAVLQGEEMNYEGNYKSVTGNKITPVRVMFATILSEDKKIEGVIGIVEDITQRKEMEELIFAEKKRLRTTLMSIGDGVISTDNNGNVTLLNRIAENLTGWTQDEAFGRPLEEVFNIINEFTREKCINTVYCALETGDIFEISNKIILISKNGIERSIENSVAPIRGEDNMINGVALVFRDVTEKKEKQAEIEYLSFHDQLTGLYNRRFFEEELKRLDTKSNLPITLVIIDVNGLKLTNDAFGHLEGDKLLQKVAKVIRKECRNEDIIARIGGDEFVIILPKTNSEETAKILNRINSAIDKEKLNSINASISYGWETKQNTNEEMLAVFKKAEDYMYRRKLSESTSMRYKTIEVIIKTLYEKNEREEKHSIRVGELCALIASSLNLSATNIGELRTAGLMHDIGKIAIDDKILNKPASLSDSEWLEIKKHPEIGYRILSSLNEYAPIAEYALAHHERWDGNGYPKGLKGEEIPWQARVIAVADAYDAMTGDRPYRKNLSKADAIEIIRKNAGTQFDPEIVKVFIEKVINE